MDINKAIKKQKKSYKRFMLIMSFIFFALPIILFLFRLYDIFYITYVVIVELLIIIAIAAKINKDKLIFTCNNSRLRIISGIRRRNLIIPCDKVALVHVENVNTAIEKDFSIIIMFSIIVRNKGIIKVNEKFLSNHPYVAFHYKKLKILNPEKNFSFSIIKKGGVYKYQLLDIIYKNCVNAIFTEETVDKIKEYRNCKL